MSLNAAGRMAAAPRFISSVTPHSSRLLAIRGGVLARAVSGISISSADSAPDNQLRVTTSTEEARPQIQSENTEEVSTSGRSSDPIDHSNGQIPAATLTASLPNDPYLHPTQSWGGDEITSSRQEAEKTKPRSSGGLAKRVVFGLLMGIAGASAVLAKPLFLIAATFITYHATIEYYSMVTSKDITKGMAPPPPIVSSLTTVLCISMVVWGYFFRGKSGTVLAIASFFLLVMNLVAIRKPKFSMLASTLFGLFYCGWLPSFWVKLRLLPMQAPEIPFLPSLVAPLTGWTVGLLATFTSAACVVAADTGAYFVGKSMGRTKLTEISPKKTVEGAVGGLASSVAVAIALSKLTQWPSTPLAAAGLGVFTFFASLFGDLIESIIKRDAGMKDSGNLIPGHGGLLDRFDSYMFTGAMSYFYIVFVLPVLPSLGL